MLNFKFPDDVMAGFDQLEREVRQYHAITEKHIDEDTISGVILEALAKSSNEKHRDFPNHLVLNAYRLDSYNKILVEIWILAQHKRETEGHKLWSSFQLGLFAGGTHRARPPARPLMPPGRARESNQQLIIAKLACVCDILLLIVLPLGKHDMSLK